MHNHKNFIYKTFNKINYLPLFIIIVLSIATRFFGISRRSIWYDEAVTLGVLRLSFIEHLHHCWDHELNNQLIYYFLMRPWSILGETELAIRSFSVVFSVAAVALLYLLGRRLFGNKEGFIAALILALHSSAIRYAQEARSYSLTVFLVILSSFFLVRFIDGGKYRDLFGWIITSIISFYSHFFAALIFEAQIVSLIFLGIKDLRYRKALIIASFIIILFYSPAIIYAIQVPKQFISWIPELSFFIIYVPVLFLAGGSVWLLFAYLVSFILLTGKVFQNDIPKISRWRYFLTVSWAIFPIITLSIISFRQPILLDRYVIFSIPAWALSVGAVLGSNLNRSRIGTLLVLVTVGLFILFEFKTIVAVNNDLYEDWRTPAHDVASATLPGDVIIYESSWAGLAFEYYLNKGTYRPTALQTDQLLISKAIDIREIEKNERIWLVLSRPNLDYEEIITAYLRQSHPIITSKLYGSNTIEVILFDTR